MKKMINSLIAKRLRKKKPMKMPAYTGTGSLERGFTVKY